MEESGSEGLDEFILAEVKKGKDSWFEGVDAVCIVCNPYPSVSYAASHYTPSSPTTTG
jgi:Cys-Gly metallodipeptidase DUG1